MSLSQSSGFILQLSSRLPNCSGTMRSSSGKAMRSFCCSEEEKEAEDGDALLSGLPEHLALLCLARVPHLSTMWGVSRSWRRLLYSNFFHSSRAELGQHVFNWLYVLVASGSSSSVCCWYAFDSLASQWHSLPPMPGDVCFELSSPGFIGHRHPIQCTSTAHKLIVVAGTRSASSSSSSSSKAMLEPALESPLVFDTMTGKWSPGPSFTVPRRWCTCGTVGEMLLVASGSGREWDMKLSKSAEICDMGMLNSSSSLPSTWQPVSRLPTTKLSGEATSAVSLAGKLYMVSGCGVFVRIGVVFDPETGAWSDMAPGLRSGWKGSCVATDGRFFVLDDAAGRLKVYDPGADRWSAFLEDPRLKNMANVVAAHGKICGSVHTADAGSRRSLVRIVDVTKDPVQFFELAAPTDGQIVGLQVLAGMKNVT